MIKTLSLLFKRLQDLGVFPGMAAFDAKHVRLCNTAAFIAGVASFAFFLWEIPLVTDWGKTNWREFWIIMVRGLSVLPFFLPLWFNKKGRFAEARMALVVWTCFLIIEMGWIFGGLSPSHLFLIVLSFLLYSLFPPTDKTSLRAALLLTLATFAAFLSLRAWHAPLIPVERVEIRLIMEIMVATGCLLLAMIGGRTVRDTTLRAEKMALFERDRADRLLLNILPESVATRLKDDPGTIADGFLEVTVLFADLVDFTPLSASLSPRETVTMMDMVFSRFDALVEEHGLEKIKTIGDAYMLAGGLPDPVPDHARQVVEMALSMQEEISRLKSPCGVTLQLRIGIATGPVVAGVIGRKKFLYDLWGDTVNTASRLESAGAPGRIHVSESTRDQLPDGFLWEDRGTIPIKGKGSMRTWFLVGKSDV